LVNNAGVLNLGYRFSFAPKKRERWINCALSGLTADLFRFDRQIGLFDKAPPKIFYSFFPNPREFGQPGKVGIRWSLWLRSSSGSSGIDANMGSLI
jgi:hypothetical protein